MLGELYLDDGEDPRSALRRFIVDLYDFLDRLVAGRDDFWRPYWETDLEAPMRAAWAEAEPGMDEILADIDRIPDAAIRRHGLSGSQLRFKFAVINRCYRQPAAGFGIAGFRKLIDALDVLLESILGVIPGGGGVAEIKDYIALSVRE